MIIGLSTLAPIFNAVGKTRLTMFTNLISVLPVILLAPIFGYIIGPYGLILAVIVSDLVTCAVGLPLAARYLSARIDYSSTLKILFVSLLTGGIVYLGFTNVKVSNILLFASEGIMFFLLYFIISPIIRSIDISDIQRLNTATGGLRVISKIFSTMLKFEEILLRLTDRIRKNI